MWRIWFFFGILEISFGAPVKTSQGEGAPSTELVVLKCLLSSPLNSCNDVKRTVEKIPKRIQKLYEKLKKPLQDAASNELFDIDSFDNVPISLLYLIPEIRLYPMSGLVASKIVRKFPVDVALSSKILGLLTNDTKIQDFLTGLSKFDEPLINPEDSNQSEEDSDILDIPFISPAVEEEIGIALSKWFPNGSYWEFWLFEASMMSGTPILANLPSYFLNSLPLKTTEKFLYHLRNWRWDQNAEPFYEEYSSSMTLWTRHSMAVRRIWAHIVLTKAEEPGKWNPRILNQLGFLLTGATPDELNNLPSNLRYYTASHVLLYMDWSPLQARSVFDILYSEEKELKSYDLMNLKNMVANLLPRQLQQFLLKTADFEFVMNSDDKISLPTKKQIFEIQLAYKFLKNHTKGLHPSDWKRQISSFGKFIHILPASKMKEFANETFNVQTLGKIDSSYLTYRQIRYLIPSNTTVNYNSTQVEGVFSMKNLLKGLPVSQLVETGSDKLFQNVKEHLLMFTSGNSLVSMATVLEKVRSDFADVSFLEKMLYNKNYAQYFNLLGSRDITRKFKDVSSNLFILVNKDPNLERNIRLLPYNTLSDILSLFRQQVIANDGGWTYENLIESPLKTYIAGLSCLDIKHLEVSDFLPVIGYYVRHRRALGQVFPKNMQYCCQYALMDYLKMKAKLREIQHDSENLFHLIEPFEIKAVGGYILAGLPPDMVILHPRKQQMISEIGKLTIPELLTSTSLKNLKKLANSYYQEPMTFHLKSINDLGNLIWFLSGDNIQRLGEADFKLYLESLEENTVKTLCFDEMERNTWKSFLINVFGTPDSWSPGTLKHLGDLLFVLDRSELEKINKTSWIEAADILAGSTDFFYLMEWPGKTKTVPLLEVCYDILHPTELSSYKQSVKNLLRFYLEAAQFLLDTTIPSDRLLKWSDEPNQIPKINGIQKLHFVSSLLANPIRNSTTGVENVTNSSSSSKDSDSVLQTLSERNGKILSDYDVKIVTESITLNKSAVALTAMETRKTDTSTQTSEEDFPEMDGNDAQTKEIKSLTDMIQGDQEFDNDEDDYDYAKDYSTYNEQPEYDIMQDVLQEPEVLTEADVKERIGRFIENFNFFNIFSNKKEESTETSHKDISKKRRSINTSEEQIVSESHRVGEKDSNVYRSYQFKTLEEKKTELKVNGSRDLIVEVPVNISATTKRDNCPKKQAVKITCDAIRILGKSASLVLDHEDIANMSDVELEDCSEVLGNLELEHELRLAIWKRLKEWKESGNLMEVGNLISAIGEEEIPDITLDLSKPWAYENLNALSKHVIDPFLMSQASDEFLLKNINMSVLSYEASVAMGRLVCTMTLAHQKKLLLSQSHVFVNTATILGSTIECSNKIFESCIFQLARLSTSSEAFGHTKNWCASDVSTLGVIVAGLDKEHWNDGRGNGLKPEALAGLSPLAASCMAPETLMILTEEQLSNIPTMSAAALSQAQISGLSSSQLAALNRVRRQVTHEDVKDTLFGAATKTQTPVILQISVTICIIYNYFISRTFF